MRTAFLVYVRLLLCLQGLYLGFWTLMLSPRSVSQTGFVPQLGLAALFAALGLTGIVVAVALRPGRRWAVIIAIVIELLWAAAAAALGVETLREWPIDVNLLGLLTIVGALLLATVAGLLTRPVRAYAGLSRR
jgi:hypothetical protein